MVAWLLTWPTPAPIFTSTALSATQLDATAAGVTGAALPAAFVYSPAAGTTLAAGSEVSKHTFTPTDNGGLHNCHDAGAHHGQDCHGPRDARASEPPDLPSFAAFSLCDFA